MIKMFTAGAHLKGSAMSFLSISTFPLESYDSLVLSYQLMS